MALRHWLQDVLLRDGSSGNDLPPPSALVNTLLGRTEDRIRALGEYDSASYPAELRELVETREAVARDLLSLPIAAPEERIESIPRLRELLRRYPHPLVYETLINACLDAGRYDEAKGVAFAARQRRAECLASEYPEIRAEVNWVREWQPAEIDGLREVGGRR